MEKGWQPDPDNPGLERWWDGEAWGSETRPRNRGDVLRQAGKKSSEQDLRPRRRRRKEDSNTLPHDTIPTGEQALPPTEKPPAPEFVPGDPPAHESPGPEFVASEDSPDADNDSPKPSFVELSSAPKNIGAEKDWGAELEEPAPSQKRRKTPSGDQSFEEFGDLQKDAIFASFEENSSSSFTPFEKPGGEEVSEEDKSSKERPPRETQKSGPGKKSKRRKKVPKEKTQEESVSQKHRKKPSIKKPDPAAALLLLQKSRERVRTVFRGRDNSSALGTASRKMLPIGIGIILIIVVAALAGPLIEGEEAPPKTLQDRLEQELAAKRKEAREPYPNIERCIEESRFVNSALLERSEQNEPQWKIIYVNKNYQLVTLTQKESPAAARDEAEITKNSFLTASAGRFYIQGPLRAITGSQTLENRQISQYMSQLASCLGKL